MAASIGRFTAATLPRQVSLITGKGRFTKVLTAGEAIRGAQELFQKLSASPADTKAAPPVNITVSDSGSAAFLGAATGAVVAVALTILLSRIMVTTSHSSPIFKKGEQ